MNKKYYEDLFLKRIEETKNELVLEDESGTRFLESDVFEKFLSLLNYL